MPEYGLRYRSRGKGPGGPREGYEVELRYCSLKKNPRGLLNRNKGTTNGPDEKGVTDFATTASCRRELARRIEKERTTSLKRVKEAKGGGQELEFLPEWSRQNCEGFEGTSRYDRRCREGVKNWGEKGEGLLKRSAKKPCVRGEKDRAKIGTGIRFFLD